MFLNPLMLAGIGGAAVPLALHFLSRARHRPVQWGAMIFLTGIEARRRNSARVKQWVLLLLRMLTVAVLAVALARPVLRGRLGEFAGTGRATAVIILDDSGSMNYVENGRSRLALARQAALQIMSAMNRGDQVSLLVTRTPQTNADRAPTSDLQSIAARVAAIRPGAADASFADSLSRAADVLERYERQNREIYVVCDRQAFSWRRVNEMFARTWRTRWASAGTAAPRIKVIEVGGDVADNVVVESIEPLSLPLIKDQPFEVEVQLRNYGRTPRGMLPLALRFDGRVLTETTVTLAAGATATVRATVRLPDSGSHVLSATVKSSGLTNDDRLDRAIDVSEPIRVLIVSGDAPDRDAPDEEVTAEGAPPGPSFADAGALLQLALAPHVTSGQQGADAATVELRSPGEWSTLKLERADVLILANVERLTPQQTRDVEQFVFGGGGLLIAPGSLSRVDEYDNTLFRFGAGIIPASLAPATAIDGSSASALRSVDLNHPVFRFLNRQSEPMCSSVVAARYFPATPRTSDAAVLSTLASGAPFLIESGAGRGRVLLVTSSFDPNWTTMPSTRFFLPFIQSAVRYLARTANVNRNLVTGQSIIASVDEPVDERSATLRAPSGQVEPLAVSRFGDRADLRYARTEEAGTYRVRYRSEGKDRMLQYVVAAPRAESDLTPMSEERWRHLSQTLGFERIDPLRTPVASAVARDRSGRELWAAALAGVLTLAGAEMLLARLWSADDS